MNLEEVEFDFQVTEETFRKPTELETVLNKKFYYGKGGLVLNINEELFLKKEDADKIAKSFQNMIIRNEIFADSVTPLEAFAYQILTKCYGN